MQFKIKLPNAITFFLILFLLFWCFTWNIPTDYDISYEGPCELCERSNIKNDIPRGSDIFSIKSDFSNEDQNYDSWLHESRNLEKTISTSNAIIPSFKEWRKMEMAKQERNFEKDKIFHQDRKFTRRKLNYASSKCGAKILASNPEARHRMAILSEKSDEYFLNPCRVKTWFVIELCDAVEVIQVELANYELYSSSPKEFSVFYSEVYPSYLWNHLGTFTAEDRRTMQTFDIRKQRMGKFIKVIIHSHHGKEHYCPLSVIRVLGYSMVQTLDIENDEDRKDSDFNSPSEEESVSPLVKEYEQLNETEIFIKLKKNNFIKSICEKLFLHCSYVFKVNVDHACLYKPVCRYLEQIVDVLKINCQDFYCPRYPPLLLTNFNYISDSIRINDSSSFLREEAENANSNMNNNLDVKDIIKDYEHKKLLRIKKESSVHEYIKLKDKSEKSNDKRESYHKDRLIQHVCKNKQHSARSKKECDQETLNTKNSDTFEKDIGGISTKIQVTTKESILPELKRNGDDIDSAGLISKESVLYKLAAKIKSSETDLNLINKYLQQLSQSYRYQTEYMKIKFPTTLKAMVEESEKATEVNVKQEEKISVLKGKIDVLNKKISFLMNGKNEMTKRVIELHGFFLILEIIIIATVFNIFMNIFNKRKNSYDSFR